MMICRPMRSAAELGKTAFTTEGRMRVAEMNETSMPVASVDSNHPGGAVLQQAVREATGGCSHVHADFSREFDLPVFERALQFETAAANILEIFSEETNGGLLGNLGAGFADFLSFDQYFTGENQSLSSVTGASQAAFYQELIESEFQGRSVYSWPSAGKVKPEVVPGKC
jgi:hypothetical protein